MHKGFSLVELVVVVFMISILVAMSTGVVYFCCGNTQSH